MFFRKNKKGVELATNAVVIIVLVLLVLLVLAFIFMGGTQNWFKANDCEKSHSGNCLPSCPSGTTVSPWSCPDKGQRCCVTLQSIQTGQ